MKLIAGVDAAALREKKSVGQYLARLHREFVAANLAVYETVLQGETKQ